MAMDALRREAAERTNDLYRLGLARHSRGAVSIIDRAANTMAIAPADAKPGAVEPGDIVLINLQTFEVRDGGEGAGAPDLAVHTHLFLAQMFARAGAIATFSSPYATAFALARRDLLPYSAAHAQHFLGSVPVVRSQTPNEVEYEFASTIGLTIVDEFSARGLDYMTTPAALVPGGGPVAWGSDGVQAVANAAALEEAAHAAYLARALTSDLPVLTPDVVRAHYTRAHGIEE